MPILKKSNFKAGKVSKKYELTDQFIDYSFKIPHYHHSYNAEEKTKTIRLYRIRALRNFGNVKKGNIGGYIESENNLSHKGNCWIGDNAKVSMQCEVSGNAHIFGDAELTLRVKAYGNVKVYGKAKLSGQTEAFDESEIYGEVETEHMAKIYGKAHVFGYSKIVEWAHVFGNAMLDRDTINGHKHISKTPIRYKPKTYTFEEYYNDKEWYEKMREEKCTLNLFEKYVKRGTLIGLLNLIIDFFIAKKKLK